MEATKGSEKPPSGRCANTSAFMAWFCKLTLSKDKCDQRGLSVTNNLNRNAMTFLEIANIRAYEFSLKFKKLQLEPTIF